MTKAVDIEAAITKALTAAGLTPSSVVNTPGASDSALLSFAIDTASRHVTVGVTIPPAPQKVLAPGWGTSYFDASGTTAALNANMGPSGGPALKRYPWSSLESAEGVYSLGAIGQAGTILDDLEQTRLWNVAHPTQPRQMIVMVEDKNFLSGVPCMLPAYLRTEHWSDPVYSSGQAAVGYEMPITSNMGPGTCALRWVPRIVARLQALHAYIATQLDGVAEFAGIALMETALGFSAVTATRYGYSAQRYADSLVAVLASASKAFVQSKVLWFFNFIVGGENLLGYIASAIAAFPAKNVLAGGPDLLPESGSLTQPGFAYSFYPQMAALGIKMFIQLSPPGYSEAHSAPPAGRYWSFQELHDYAVNTLKVSHILAVPTNGQLKYADLVKLMPTLPLV